MKPRAKPAVTWNGPVRTAVDHVPVRHTLKRAPRKGLRQVSSRRQRELQEYLERRISFLKLPQNQWCPVHISGVMGTRRLVRAVEVHHKAGRVGKLLNDERWWLAVSRAGHTFIHANPNLARERGWII